MSVRAYSISGYEQNPPLAISGTAASTIIADTSDYLIWSDVNCYIKIGAPNQTPATSASGMIIYAGSKTTPVYITAGSQLSAVSESGAGNLRLHKVGVLR